MCRVIVCQWHGTFVLIACFAVNLAYGTLPMKPCRLLRWLMAELCHGRHHERNGWRFGCNSDLTRFGERNESGWTC